MDELFYFIFSGLPRLGPGDDTYTRKAFYSIPVIPDYGNILDIGCGTGHQTLELARLTNCQILALDNHIPFLHELNQKAKYEKLDNKVITIIGDMHSLPFSEAEFDLIWSEGSIYIIGFEKGLNEWRKFLKPGGYIVVSELSWIKNDAPLEAREFWKKEYPDMKTDLENKKVIHRSGFDLIREFNLSKRGWWDYFYKPLQSRLLKLRKEHPDNHKLCELLDYVQREIDLYKNYGNYFDYIFYIMKNTG